MVCCAGLPDILGPEVKGLDYETVLGLFGREFGLTEDILPRINKPGSSFSLIRFDPEDYVHIRKELERNGTKSKTRPNHH